MVDTWFEAGKKLILEGAFPDGWIKGNPYIRIHAIRDDRIYFTVGMVDASTGEKLFEHGDIFTVTPGNDIMFLNSDDTIFSFEAKIKLGG